jgi:hypothetical protein
MFEPGKSGNPAGRPRGTGNGIRELARTYSREMLEILVNRARKGSIQAAIAVLDRGWGRPEQSIDFKMVLEKKLTELDETELLAFRDKILALNTSASAVIEHHKPDE